jgi:uncharacterized protein
MGMTVTTGRVLVAGAAEGLVLRLSAALSFWGGVDARSGFIVDPRHPQYGASVSGRILAVERTIGSSSGSSVLLELAAAGKAPAAIVVCVPDAIVALGAVVAEAMGYQTIPVVVVERDQLDALPSRVSLDRDGRIRAEQL